jgi:hypothetical protein
MRPHRPRPQDQTPLMPLERRQNPLQKTVRFLRITQMQPRPDRITHIIPVTLPDPQNQSLQLRKIT